MTCPRCGEGNPSQARFCMKCGASVALACAKCGTELPAGAAFCFACGQAVAAAASTATKAATPASYTPKHLAERILISKAALEGERKQVTVLFADLKGSMELLADRDPEEARKLLDPVLEHMMEAVHRFEGTVNQVMGDGIMALFGAPLAHEDHAVRACYAALRMQETVKRYAEEVRREHGVTIRIRVGLNSGEVVVRSIGSDLHMDYTAVGQTTHLAARMEQLADPGTTLLTPHTLALAEGFVEVRGLGPMAVKGLPAPMDVFELAGASAVRSRLQAATRRGLTRFVGRDTEIEQLRHALALAGEGHGQVVGVVGEPGVGKSRLFHEFTHSHRTQDWLIVQGSSVSYGKATSYFPVIDLLKSYFKIGERDSHREIRAKVTGGLLTLDRALEGTLTPILALLDVPTEDRAWAALDPLERRQQTLDAVRRLLLRESQVQPLLVVFEDLHWIDPETQVLLEGLVDGIPATRLLLLVNYRPEYRHGWGHKTYYTQLRLDALPPETAGELLDGLLGQGASVVPLRVLLMARTAGNPLFMEESVRSLVETHVLAGERGAYRLARPLEPIEVPATVQAILAARIDRLAPDDKALLQAAAVVGKDVPLAVLRAIVPEPEERLRRGLAALQAAEFLYETSLFPDVEYTFKHALTHEVAYGGLLHERRQALHRKVVETIEQVCADRLDEQVERLAEHAVRGMSWDKAVSYARQAGVKAAARSAYASAVPRFEQALTALAQLPEGETTLKLGIDVTLELRLCALSLGDVERTLGLAQDALAAAERLGDHRRLALALNAVGNSFCVLDDPARGVESHRRALGLTEDLGDNVLRAGTLNGLALGLVVLGDFQESRRFQEEALALLNRDTTPTLPVGYMRGPVFGRVWLAWGLAELGEFAQAFAVATEAVRLAEETKNPYFLAGASWGLAYARFRQGDFGSAAPLWEVAQKFASEESARLLWSLATAGLGAIRTASGHVAEGLALLEESLAPGAQGTPVARALRTVWLGEALRLAGRSAEAAAIAQQALAIARNHRQRGHEAYALRLISEVAPDGDSPNLASAETHCREALALATELGMRPLVAHCHLGLGKLYGHTGKRQEAQEHLTIATALYREMGMMYWLERLEREMRELA